MGTVRQEVARIEENVANAYAAAAIKGAILPASETIANLANTINTIQSATDLNDSVCGYESYLSKVTCGGGCVQNNIPAPSQPSNVICNNGEIRFNKRDVPVGYTPLSYLESTGTQAILTNYMPLGDDTIEVDYKLTNLSQGGDKFIIGSRPSTSAENVGFWVETYGATNTWYVRYGSPSAVNNSYQSSDESGTFSITKNVFKINGVTRLAPAYEGDPVYPMSIFARRNRNDTAWAGAYIQISNVRVYGSDNALKHNYIPVKNSSNVLGMYDTVYGQFFSNVGSGDFTSGQELHRIPDNLEILDKVYFTGSPYSHEGGTDYSNQILTSLNLNDVDSPTKATDWMNVKIEIDAKAYNQTMGYPTPSGLTSYSVLFYQTGVLGYGVNNYLGGSLRIGYADSDTNASKISTLTYRQNTYASQTNNNEHRCLYSMDFANSNLSVYDKETNSYIVNDSITVTNYEIPEVNTDPMSLIIGATATSTSAPKMYLYEVKVTRTTDNKILYHGVPAMDYNTGLCGLFDFVSGNFDQESGGTARLVPGNVVKPIYNIIGTQERIEDITGNISTVSNLLALDSTVIDTQELKEGVINRQVGIKVLNGTETWEYTNQGTYGNSTFASTDAITDRDYTKRFAYCTHFQNTESTSDLTTNGKMFLGVSSQKINFCNTSVTTPADFADWLKAQYNAGTPVIILYPLTTDVDIEVPAQNQLQHTPLTQITGSISNLPIDSYKVIQKRTIDVTGKFTNIEHIDKNSFFNLFQYGYCSGITFIWDDNVSQFRQKTYGDLEFTNLKSMSLNASMNGAFACTAITSASFPALTDFEGSVAPYGETATGAPFQNAFNNANSLASLSFGALQTIPSGNDYLFYKITSNCGSLTTISYPLLEAILCQRAFGYAFNGAGVVSVTFPNLKFIDGYYTFDNAFANCTYLQTVSFPSLGIPYLAPGFPLPQVSIGTYTFQNAFSGCGNLTEIHFRANIQSQIEAQAGYSTKWGATNATIYFDL